MQKIGILGGSFDPVHDGHLRIARLALQEFQLEKIYFVPLRQAVHKAQPVYSAEDRIKMLKDAIRHDPEFSLELTELNRTGPSLAIDTVRYFSRTFTDKELYYIIGSDAFERIFTWKNPEELLKLVKFIVIARPGHDFSGIERIFAKHSPDFLDRIFLIEDPDGIDISSTKLREKINADNHGD